MEVILVRHGITEGNKEKRFVGRLDVPLAPDGEAMARETAPLMPEVEHLYVSPMLRCRQTANLLWPGVPRTIVEDLRETDFGIFEGKNHAELQDDPAYQRWLAGEMVVGEPAEDCARRGARALAFVGKDATEHGYEHVGVVSHGGLLMGMLTLCGRPARKGFYDWFPQNCSRSRVERRMLSSSLRVRYWPLLATARVRFCRKRIWVGAVSTFLRRRRSTLKYRISVWAVAVMVTCSRYRPTEFSSPRVAPALSTSIRLLLPLLSMWERWTFPARITPISGNSSPSRPTTVRRG